MTKIGFQIYPLFHLSIGFFFFENVVHNYYDHRFSFECMKKAFIQSSCFVTHMRQSMLKALVSEYFRHSFIIYGKLNKIGKNENILMNFSFLEDFFSLKMKVIIEALLSKYILD